MPSPEQGASTSTLSKKHENIAAIVLGSSFVTTQLDTPILSIFDERISARFLIISFDTRSPNLPIRPAIWVLLPPGAAQRSHTNSPGFGSSKGTAHIALGS